MTAQVIAIANRKGGVGKTTTAVNLAAELGARGRRVLVVDFDTQGHAVLGLGLDPRAKGARAHDGLGGAPFAADAARPTVVENVDAIPPNPDYRPGGAASHPASFARALAPLASVYDYIVIDVAPALDEALIGALVASDHVVIPTLLTPLAHDGVGKFSRILLKVATLMNRSIADIAVLPTQADLHAHMQREVLAKLTRDFGPRRLLPVIRIDSALAEAFGARLPARRFRPGGGAFDYGRVAERILQIWSPEAARLIA
jgi:chromosome partitioning protein